jgi:hypothetical protein
VLDDAFGVSGPDVDAENRRANTETSIRPKGDDFLWQ